MMLRYIVLLVLALLFCLGCRTTPFVVPEVSSIDTPAPTDVSTATPYIEPDILVGTWKSSGFYYHGMAVALEQVPSIASMYKYYTLTISPNGDYDVFDLLCEKGTWAKTISSEHSHEYRLNRQFYSRYTYSTEEGAYEELTESVGETSIFLDETDRNTLFVVLDDEYWLICTRESMDNTYKEQKGNTLQDSGSDKSSYMPTSGEQNALDAARLYLDIMPFSYKGLTDQLKYDGYTDSEARYAADHCGADWYHQAVLSAKKYLEIMSFSKSGLISQLEYEGYTHDQALYGVDRAY